MLGDSMPGNGNSMASVRINEWHLRRLKKTGDMFRAKKLSFSFYLLESTKGELMGRHLAKIVEELSEAVDASNR